jgi:hydroxyacylglutathione hydrolase
MINYKITKFVNPYKNANTFVIELNNNDIVIVDFGNYPINDFVDWITQNEKKIIGLVLTHEHADHCFGVDQLKSRFDFKLYCSEKCEINMRNPKQNYSRYIDDFESFGVQSMAEIVKDGQILNFKGYELIVIETPGHSPGGICLVGCDNIFTGDTILNNVKSPLCFPHSNKLDYINSLNKILGHTNLNSKLFPGHGEPVEFKDINWDFYISK